MPFINQPAEVAAGRSAAFCCRKQSPQGARMKVLEKIDFTYKQMELLGEPIWNSC